MKKVIKLSQLSESLQKQVKEYMNEGVAQLSKLPKEIRVMVESDMDADVSKRRSVKVTFDNGDVITTPINGTKKEIEDYYLNKYFNIGSGEEDEMAKVTGVEFLEDNS